MSKIAFIYPGQGAQKAGMGADFYENSEIARYIFDQAGDELMRNTIQQRMFSTLPVSGWIWI